MTQPIDFTIPGAAPLPDPTNAFMQGIQQGVGLQQIQVQQAQQQQAVQQQQQQQLELRSLIANPNATVADVRRAYLLVPGLEKQLGKWLETATDQQRQSQLSDSATWLAAIQSEEPELAAKAMEQRAQAIENTAKGPTPEAQAYRDKAALVRADPVFAGFILKGSLLSHGADGERVVNSIVKLNEDQRAQQQAPWDLRKKAADAKKAEIDANTAPEKSRLELLRAGAELGLTSAQTNEALKRTEKLGYEARKAALDLEAAGGLDPEKQFDFETKLRKEYSDQTKDFQQVQEAHRRLLSAKDDAAGDLSLIFSYMKMLDPGSVVREGEFANAQNAGGVPDRVLNVYNRLRDGERLTPGQRKMFIGQGKALLDAAQMREQTVRDGLGRVIKSYRLNPDNVFYTAEPASSQSGTGASGQASPPAMPSRYQGRKWATY